MRKTVDVPVSEVIPSVESVLRGQGVTDSGLDDPYLGEIAETALKMFAHLCSPAALTRDIDREDFETVYRGHGRNADETPVELIYPNAKHMALYAVTVGPRVGERVTELFDMNEFALGAMLDMAASEATELLAGAVEDQYRQELRSSKRTRNSSGVMRFSPGYCGWDLSGQGLLFERLGPEEIGIELRETFLMTPLKSTSGVMIAGHKDIFEFECSYSFCNDCTTFSCRDRLEGLRQQ